MFERILKQLFSKYSLPLKCFKPILSFRGKFHCCKIGFGNNLLTYAILSTKLFWSNVKRLWPVAKKLRSGCKKWLFQIGRDAPLPSPAVCHVLYIEKHVLSNLTIFLLGSAPFSGGKSLKTLSLQICLKVLRRAYYQRNWLPSPGLKFHTNALDQQL